MSSENFNYFFTSGLIFWLIFATYFKTNLRKEMPIEYTFTLNF